jgi:hypothetical protein
MAECDRIVSDKNLLDHEPQNLLTHPDIRRLGSDPQLASKGRQAFGKLKVFCFVHRRHDKRL